MQVFKGQLIGTENPRTAEDGSWASIDIILKEFNPQNPDYPQIVKMGMFKKGEYLKYAENFDDYYNIGDVVEASYNFKASKYKDKKTQEMKAFYSIGCWKMEKVAEDVPQDAMSSQENQEPVNSQEEVSDNLPF